MGWNLTLIGMNWPRFMAFLHQRWTIYVRRKVCQVLGLGNITGIRFPRFRSGLERMDEINIWQEWLIEAVVSKFGG